MSEYLKQNEHSLNQAALKALKALKVKPEDGLLYVYQLMQVGLRRENYQLLPQNRVDQQDMVDDLPSTASTS